MKKEIYNELIKRFIDKNKVHSSSTNFQQISLFFEIFINKKYSVKEKYIFLNNSLNNIFLSNTCKNEIFTIFSKIQKIFFSLLRFKYLLLFKKSKLVVENDLSLNPIRENEKYIIVILQGINKYIFHIRDLLQIINSSIGRSEYFFSIPIPVKNPYNNSIFTKSNLYNIYFFIKFQTNYFSEIFHSFFLSNFDLSKFFIKNQSLLRSFAIQDYYKNSSESDLSMDIEEMLEDFNYENQFHEIKIDKDFPNKKLLEIMKPYLYLYLLGKNSYLECEKNYSKKQLKQKLKDFYSFNPSFGRKLIKKKNLLGIKNNIENDISFIDEYLSFNQNKRYKNDFLGTHYIF
jgi:hypothetical protein